MEQGTRPDPNGFQVGECQGLGRASVWKRAGGPSKTNPARYCTKVQLCVETRIDQQEGTIKRAKHGRPRGMYFQNRPAA